MKRKLAGIAAAGCCAGVLLAGCAGGAGPAETAVDYVGVYPQEGYVPAAGDIDAVPYTYAGRGTAFSVECKVRALTEEEQVFVLQLKSSTIQDLEQLRQEYPERGYGALIEKTASELAVLKDADALYVTEVFGSPIGETAGEDATVEYQISSSGETVLSGGGSLKSERWLSVMNTADGAYSEGTLLPCRERYEITIRYGEQTDTFELSRQ